MLRCDARVLLTLLGSRPDDLRRRRLRPDRGGASRTCPRSSGCSLIVLVPLVGPIAWLLAGRAPVPPSAGRGPATGRPARVAPTTTPTSSVTCDGPSADPSPS